MPRIVAESLAAVADPLRTALTPGPPASAVQVARALARSLLPAESAAAPPAWLLPGQARSFRRALAALDRFGGALIADPVGSGKTFVALAVAAVRRRPTVCLVPATLGRQWVEVARRLGVMVEIGTHEQASRGRLPDVRAGLVIIDESHHFRNQRTRRYSRTAPWLVGREVLLLTATPIVNRLDDLAHQLLLGVRDDALIADGVVSLRATLAAGSGAAALGRLVIEDTAEAGPRPLRRACVSSASEREEIGARELLESLSRLRLSLHPPIAALIRAVLVRAAASSPAALAGALRRYRGLLLHGADAQRAGRSLGRAELREFAGELDDQLVLWELVSEGNATLELALDDVDAIEPVIHACTRAAEPDDKAQRLRALLADDRPTLVFTARRETVRYLRDRLAGPVAWCTGDRAGLGHATTARSAVMRWFQEAGPHPMPRCLLTTDVAAEGLDLRRAERVVHYDLPWTPMRLEQREGRAVRLGSAHAHVEVVRFPPPAALEAALCLGERLARKAALPGRAGLGSRGARLWRWRTSLADRLGGGAGVEGTALVSGTGHRGVLAGFSLVCRRGETPESLGAVVGWLGADGEWSEDAEVVEERVLAAACATESGPLDSSALGTALDGLANPIRARLALAGGRRWTQAEPGASARRVAERLSEAVAEAARQRDRRRLERLERAMRLAAGGHTAGEEMVLDSMAEAPTADLLAWLDRLSAPDARGEPIEARLTGLVVFDG
ncbi:MAG TPA: DEAD/DEAH box helicase [Gemmatimonadales bacterium]|nr:DEAD/DEAH box helicase [Gemmatimonadales bacterium]